MLKGLFEIPAKHDERINQGDMIIIVQPATVNGEKRDDGYHPNLVLGFWDLEEDGGLRLGFVTAAHPAEETMEAAKVWLERYGSQSTTFAEAVELLVRDGYEAYTEEKMSALMEGE